MNTYFKFLIIMAICTNISVQANGDKQQKQLSFVQNIAVGSAVGVAEVAFPGQPLSYMANKVVQGHTIARNPMHWYKGGIPNAAGIAPITAIQKVANAQATSWVKTAQGAELSDAQKVAVGFGAGVAGAVAATPQEAISIYMQNNTRATMAQSVQELKWRAWRGFGPTATREGLFTAGYQAVEPMMQQMTKSAMGDTAAAGLAGSVTTGVVVAIASQPFAVVKTLMQSDPSKTQYKNSFDTACQIYSKDGVKGFFKGGAARGTRVAIAVPLYAYYTKEFTQVIQNK